MRSVKNKFWIERFKKIHGDKYDYSLVNYVNNRTKVNIICPKHGDFEQTPEKHAKGQNCPKCSREKRTYNKLSCSEFIDKAKLIHGDKFDYSDVDYINSHTKVTIICPKHGDFEQTPNAHLSKQKCPSCSNEDRLLNNKKKYTTYFKNRSRQIHNNKYDYSLINIENAKTPIKIICPIHGIFKQTPSVHLIGCNCPKCSKQTIIYNKNLKYGSSIIERFKHIHKDKYDYSLVDYLDLQKNVKIICKKHGIFKQRPDNHLMGKGCPKCGIHYSSQHEYIKKLLIDNHANFTENTKKVISPLELDFYLPDHKIAIEVNGIYWHSELAGKDKNYHLNKTEQCQDRGIQLIHINENEFINSKDIVKSKLNSILNINKRKLYGRKCEVREIDTKLKFKFLSKYHLQGNDKASVKLGLFYNGRLVSVMTFCKRRIALGKKTSNEGEYELSRFCGNFSFYVIGGASKLLKYFERNYNPSKIVTYADKRWSQGDVYFKLGFKHTHDSNPNYWYFYKRHSYNLIHRFNFRKSELNRKLDKFDPNKTEWVNMKENGWNRIWDCGNMVFEKNYPLLYSSQKL